MTSFLVRSLSCPRVRRAPPGARPSPGSVLLRLEVLEDRTAPAVFTVTHADDAGPGSLRRALEEANRAAPDEAHHIVFEAGVTGAISLATALPALDRHIAILGPGADNLTVQRSYDAGTPQFRIFEVSAGWHAAIGGLTIQNGWAPPGQSGGGIRNSGTLVVTGCVITNNRGIGGGGISNSIIDASLTVLDTTVSNNTAAAGEGGGLLLRGPAELRRCIIVGNVAAYGGGLRVFDTAAFTLTVVVTLEESSVRYNDATASGGGALVERSILTARNSDFVGNRALGGAGFGNGGGLDVLTNGHAHLENVLVRGNSARQGGGVFVWANSSLNAFDSFFTGNQASTSGGGLYVLRNGTAALNRVLVGSNTAGSGGGAFVEGTLTAFDSSFLANQADPATGDGGGLLIRPTGSVVFVGVLVQGNTALRGAGVYQGRGAAFVSIDSLILDEYFIECP